MLARCFSAVAGLAATLTTKSSNVFAGAFILDPEFRLPTA
jgi:hypothetical protein